METDCTGCNMTMAVCGFHHICGTNLEIRDNSVEWKSVASGGIFFSSRPLKYGEVAELAIEDGSGHLDIGVIQADPTSLMQAEKLMSSERLNCFGGLKEIRVHKKKLTIKMQLSINGYYLKAWTEKNEVTKINLDENLPTYIAVYIKFGGVAVSFMNVGPPKMFLQFHDVYGPNGILDLEKQVARLQDNNPMTLCCLKQPLADGDCVRLQIEPLKVKDGAIPRRYHIHVMFHNVGPEELYNTDPQSFNILKNSTATDWMIRATLEKGDISDGGQIQIEVNSRYIKHTFPNGKICQTPLSRFDSKMVWIYFKLYRVRLVLQYSDIEGDENYITPVIGVSPSKDQQKGSVTQQVTGPDHVQQIEADNRMLRNLIAELKIKRSESQESPDGLGMDVLPTIIETTSDDTEPKISLNKNIQKHYTTLKNDMFVTEIADKLFEKEYLTDAEHEHIRKTAIRNDKTDDLLTILRKRPICASLLRQALTETNQEHLIESFFGN